MSDAGNAAKSLRERLGANTEDRLGKALSELLENPLLTGAIGRAFDAREKAAQAQEVAMGALNLPSAADIERLTRRLRAVSHRLEGIEDGVDRLDRALTPSGVEARLSAIESQLSALGRKLEDVLGRTAAGASAKPTAAQGSATGTARSAAPAKAPARRTSEAAARSTAKQTRANQLRAAKEAKAKAARAGSTSKTAKATKGTKAAPGRTAKAAKASKAARTPAARSRAAHPAPGKT